jgi:uncharacterized protein (TIGR03118 family)
MNSFKRLIFPAAVVAAGIALIAAARADDPAAVQKNAYGFKVLVSDQLGAKVKDTNLKNAWGVAFSPAGSPFWIADNASGKSTLYLGDGTIVPLVVTIPCPRKAAPDSGCSAKPPSAAPTGIVFNTNPKGFVVPGTGSPAAFIFDTEDGTISAWNGSPTLTKAVLVVDNATKPSAALGAVYKGLALGVNEAGQFLFATNFRAGTVEVYDTGFKKVSTTGFKDPTIPAGYAPFGIQNIDGSLIVTYALQKPGKHDDLEGPGHGFVDAFDTNGKLLRRLATRGNLNSPWGVARASYAFGPFSGDLLVGNFGNGQINALTPTLVTLKGTNGLPLAVTGGRGLWTLTLGGGMKSNPSTLYFTSGPNDEMNGRFGTITPAQ